jgi:hypothetical protein
VRSPSLTPNTQVSSVYFLQYTNKVVVSYASVTGIRTDAHLVDDD